MTKKKTEEIPELSKFKTDEENIAQLLLKFHMRNKKLQRVLEEQSKMIDILMEMLENENKIPLPRKPPWFMGGSFDE